MNEDIKMIALGVGVFLVVALFGSGVALLKAHNEARTYNKFTHGEKATTWDALWVQLRVVAD